MSSAVVGAFVAGVAWAGMTRWELGVKVRAELDRVGGLTLMPTPIRSTMLQRAAGSQELGGVSVVGLLVVGYVSSR